MHTWEATDSSVPLRILLPALILLGAAGCGGNKSATTPLPSPTVDAEARSTPSAMDAPPAPDARSSVIVDAAPPEPIGLADAGNGEGIARDAGAGPSDGVATTPVAIACSEAKLCDDFEAYPAGAPPAGGWKVALGGNATMTVDGAKGFSGTKSVRITTPGMNAQAWMTRDKSVFPLPDNVIFGRMMTYLTAAPTGGVHWNSIEASGTRPDGIYAQYHQGAMYEKIMSNYWKPDCSRSSTTKWPVGKWACVQWQYDGSLRTDGSAGRRNEMRLWIDGKLIDDATVVRFGSNCVNADAKVSEWIAPPFTTMRLGWENYQPSPIPISMWIDDVAIDSRPIACPPPATKN